MRFWLSLAVACLLLVQPAAAEPDRAEAGVALPAGPVNTALLELARQSNLEIFIEERLLTCRNVAAIDAPDAATALALLLADTGCAGHIRDGRILIAQCAPCPLLS